MTAFSTTYSLFMILSLLNQRAVSINSVLQYPYNLSESCSWRLGRYHKDDFYHNACAWCYFFLFRSHGLFPDNYKYLKVQNNRSGLIQGTYLLADAENSTLRTQVCKTLSDDECELWGLCCAASKKCCHRQIQSRKNTTNATACGITWDGLSCWEEVNPGEKSYQSCPGYLQFSIPTRKAVKTCLKNGTWLSKDGLEWTDYTPCLSYKDLRVTLYIGLGCQVASLVLLIPSLLIFLCYKNLRTQHRIRLHINFFISFILSNLLDILWTVLVTYDKISNPQVTDTLMHKNLAWCKLLSFLKLYFKSTNYAWMFCEGFYLYRLIANAFSPPKRLLCIYLAGWGIPFTYCTTYAVLRLLIANGSCWAISMGDKEWIIYAPNLACLVVNIFFLCSILRILLTQLQAHPNEPSSFRRALKATFVLIPLFGVQLAVTIYRTPIELAWSVHYERFSEVLSNSQGFVVALIFCFFNGEVATQVKRTWRRAWMDRLSSTRKYNTTLSLHFNHSVTQRTADHSQSRRNSLEPCLETSSSKTTPNSVTTVQTKLL